MKKGSLRKLLEERKPDIIGLSETRTSLDRIKKQKLNIDIPSDYCQYFSCSRSRKGYSGTAILTKYKPLSISYGIGVERHDQEGRSITAEFDDFYLVQQYVPNSGRLLNRLTYRTEDWDVCQRVYLNKLSQKKHVYLMGDLNCAHMGKDIYNEDGMEKSAGFTPQERRNFGELLVYDGWSDVYRDLHKD